MFLFVLLFLTLYGGLNSYVYYTLISGIGHHSWPITVVLLLLVSSPYVTEGALAHKDSTGNASQVHAGCV
jgi:hypothetical protein